MRTSETADDRASATEQTGSRDASEPATGSARTDHLGKNLRNISIRGGGITLVGQTVRAVCQLVGTIVLARLLSPTAFGMVGMVTVVTGFLSLFAEMGLTSATIQRKDIEHGEISALFWITVVVGIGLSAMTALLAPVMAHIYKQPTVATVTLALSPIFLIGAIGSQHGALLRRQMRFAALVTADILSAIGATVTGIVMALMGAGYWAIVVPYLISALICTISRAASSGWSPGLPVFNERVRSMVRFGLNIILFDGFGYFARNADNFLIGWRWGPAPLGLYSRAYLLLLFPLRQINMPAGAVAVPLLCRLQDQGERYQRAYVSMTNVLCMVTVPGIAFLIITADWVVRVALGPQWNGAAHIFRFLGFAALLQPLADTGAWLFVSQGRTKEYARWGCINGILTTLSFLIGLPGGPVGVSISYAVACLIASPILFYMIGRSGPVATKSLYTILIMPMAASLSMAAGLGVFRVLFWGIGPRAGLLFTFPLALALATGTYACTRDGRAVLSEFGFMLKSLIGRTATGTLIETLGAS